MHLIYLFIEIAFEESIYFLSYNAVTCKDSNSSF